MFSLSFCGKCVAANFSIFERFKIKRPRNDECLSMYIINTIPHGKCFVRYLRTRCFCIRNLTPSLRSLIRFLIRQQLVRKYRTPALSMKYSLYLEETSQSKGENQQQTHTIYGVNARILTTLVGDKCCLNCPIQ